MHNLLYVVDDREQLVVLDVLYPRTCAGYGDQGVVIAVRVEHDPIQGTGSDGLGESAADDQVGGKAGYLGVQLPGA